MKSTIQHKPSFACVFVTLTPGDRIVAEADAMASMDSNVSFNTRTMTGFCSSLFRRIFGKESLFINEFYLEKGKEGELVLTQNTPGDVVKIDLKGTSIFLQPGAFLACAGDISVSAKWAGFKSWFSGEGLFRLQASGTGTLWFGAFGGIYEKQVQGEYLVDTAHLVAYEPQMEIHLQQAGEGLISSFTSGEGLVSRMEGTGKVWIQTRMLKGLADWINPKLWG